MLPDPPKNQKKLTPESAKNFAGVSNSLFNARRGAFGFR
jgi:hypothetical protein